MTYDIRLVAYEPNGARLGILHDSFSFDCSSVLNDVSSLTLKHNTHLPGAEWLEDWVELAVEFSTGEAWVEPPNGRFLRLAWTSDHLDETKVKDLTLPGYGWLLSTAGVRDHPEPDSSNTDDQGKRKFSAANAGIILTTLIQEAKNRGVLPGLQLDFDTALDSNGEAWDKVLTIAYEPGLTLDIILGNLADQGVIDWQVQGRTLRVFNADGVLAADRTDQVNPVTLRSGLDVVAAPDEGDSSGLVHRAYLRGEDGFRLELTNPSAPQPWGQFEATLNQGGVSDEATATLLAQAALQEGAEERVQMTRDLSFAAARFFPFVDYWPGDFIHAPGKDGGRERLRVHQVTLHRDGEGVVGGNVVLNDRFVEATIRQAKRTKGIVGGSKADGGSGALPADPSAQDTRIPAAPQGLVVQTDAYIAPSGVAQGLILAEWDAVTTATDSTALEIASYELWGRINAAGQPWRMLTVSEDTTAGHSPLEVGTNWQFRVRARGRYATTPGLFSSAVNVTIADDTTPPPKPSAPQLSSRLGTVKVYWDGLTDAGSPMPADLSHAEVYVSSNMHWIEEDFEDEDPVIPLGAGDSDAAWFRTDLDSHSGNYSLRSGVIGHSETSDAVVTVPAGAVSMRFAYKVSSEAGFDKLRVLVDGVEVLVESGEVGWVQSAYIDVDGASQVVFRYSKDSSISEGDDRAHIDDLRFLVAESDVVTSTPVAGQLQPDDFLVLTSLPPDRPVDVALRAVDRAGNVSDWSDIATIAKVHRIEGVEIADGAITANEIVAGAIEAQHIRAEAITAAKIAVDALDGKTITGAIIQTSLLSSRGIKLTGTALRAWDASGNLTFEMLSSNGNVTATGTFRTNFSGRRTEITSGVWSTWPGLRLHTGGSYAFQPSIFAPGSDSAWSDGDLALISAEQTANSSGRSQLTLMLGGNFELKQVFGTHGQFGISKSGKVVSIDGALEAVNTGPGTRQFQAFTTSFSSGFNSSGHGGLVNWSLSALPVSGTRRSVSSIDGTAATSTTSFAPYWGNANVTSTNLAVRPYHMPTGGSGSTASVTVHTLVYWT